MDRPPLPIVVLGSSQSGHLGGPYSPGYGGYEGFRRLVFVTRIVT
jgi:hypothetical protein